jgi:hypothetical protein
MQSYSPTSPSSEQKKRIQTVVDLLVPQIPKVWDFKTHIDGFQYRHTIAGEHLRKAPLNDYYAETIRILEEKFGGAELEKALADVLCYPGVTELHQPFVNSQEGRQTHAVAYVISAVATAWTLEHPSEYAVKLLGERIRYMFGYPGFSPALREALGLIDQLYAVPSALDVMEEIASGRMNAGPFKEVEPAQMSYRIHDQELDVLRRYLEHLHSGGRLSYELFEKAVRSLPGVLSSFDLGVWPDGSSIFYDLFHQYTSRLLWECAQRLDRNDCELLLECENVAGARFLIRGCELIEQDGMTRVPAEHTYKEETQRAEAIGKLVQISQLHPTDVQGDIVTQLKRFKPQTLEMIQQLCGPAKPLLMQAQGNDDLAPLQKYLERLSNDFRSEYGWVEANSSDPRKGVVDRALVLTLAGKLGPKRVAEFLQSSRKSSDKVRHAATLIEACIGTNSESVTKGFQKRNQINVKAYGLLPLPETKKDDAALARYLEIKKFASESKEFGPERQANERAATQVALVHLAQAAGFADLTRLEWSMEARLSKKAEDIPQRSRAGERCRPARPRQTSEACVSIRSRADPSGRRAHGRGADAGSLRRGHGGAQTGAGGG